MYHTTVYIQKVILTQFTRHIDVKYLYIFAKLASKS